MSKNQLNLAGIGALLTGIGAIIAAILGFIKIEPRGCGNSIQNSVLTMNGNYQPGAIDCRNHAINNQKK
jgi:hypothetical protein